MLAGDIPKLDRPVSVIPVSADLSAQAQELAQSLRNEGFFVEFSFSGNMKRRLKRADKSNARAALILGEDELKDGKVMLRDLDSGEQEAIPLTTVVQTLQVKFR